MCIQMSEDLIPNDWTVSLWHRVTRNDVTLNLWSITISTWESIYSAGVNLALGSMSMVQVLAQVIDGRITIQDMVAQLLSRLDNIMAGLVEHPPPASDNQITADDEVT